MKRLKYFPAIVLLLVIGMPSFTTANDAVDQLFAEYDKTDSPGCALGVIRDGAFVYTRGYGMANLEHGIPLDARSVFRIASTSKQFTAAAVALLAEQGKISLDDPLSRFFPGFPAWANDITVRQLVHHSSGIRDYLQLAWLAGRGDDADHFTDQWVLELLARQRETNFVPGSQYLYSNSGYLLLAHIVEQASGQSLREFSESNLFAPLGMKHSHFHDDHTGIVPRRASGYAPGDSGFRISMTTLDMVGDGGVFTTIEDLLAWDANFYDNRLGAGGPALIETLTTPGRFNDGTAMDYAFGLSVEDFHGLTLISHGGAFVGFRADMIRFPQQRFSVAVLCNRADAPAPRLARQVATHYLADLLEEAPREAADHTEPFAMPPEMMAAYAGDYWEPVEAFAAEVRLENGRLWAVHSPDSRNELVPVAADRFRMTDLPAEVLVSFERDGDTIVRMYRTIDGAERGEFTPFERRQASARELEAYAGRYFSSELNVYYVLRLDADSMMLTVPGQAPQELTPMFGETFENPDYGSFTFQRNEQGEITGFVLQSGRVRNLAFIRQQG